MNEIRRKLRNFLRCLSLKKVFDKIFKGCGVGGDALALAAPVLP